MKLLLQHKQNLALANVLSRANSSRAAHETDNQTKSRPNQIIPQEPSDSVPEEEFVVSKFGSTELLPEKPIMSLDLVKRIEKVDKKGSFSVDIFTGKYDEEFLIYPDTLDNRKENVQLKEQALMVTQMFSQMWDDPVKLQKYNFFNLYQLSVTEMMTVFEAIGASTRKCYSSAISSKESQDYSMPHQIQVSKSIISLIIRNCLTSWPIFKSNRDNLKKLLPSKHILFGGSKDDNELYRPIAFCWSEQAPTLGNLPPQEWKTLAQTGDSDLNYMSLKGRKTKILYDETIEHYLIYYRDKFMSERYNEKYPDDEPNPASDPFVGCCLVHKDQLKISPIYTDSAGCPYVDIEFDLLLHDDQIVFPAKRKDPHAVNIKALGQLATCSVVMGILKDSLKMTYEYLLNNKKGILNCDIIERKLATVTSKIFAIESMVYYISGMYDGLTEGFDAHMETAILKIVTNEYAYEALRELQHVCGSDMFIISKIQDQINIFDSFLDGNIYNRLYLSTMGIVWYARSRNLHLNQLRLSPWYPGYTFKNMLRERSERGDYLTLDADICGHLHPALKEAGLNLQYIIKRVKYATESICLKHGKDATGAQSALYQLAQLSIDAFVLTAMCARASKSYCNGSRNSEMDVAMTTSFSVDLVNDVRLYIESLDRISFHTIFNRATIINELNMKAGGYYAESPLDPNV